MMKRTKLKVKLLGLDGNAFAIIGRVSRVLRRSGYSEIKIKEFREEATEGDYDNLLRVVMNWVDVE